MGDAEATARQGAAGAAELEKAFKALKGIVETAKREGKVENLEPGEMAVKRGGTADNKEGAKILATSTAGADATSASEAALILASVSGEEMLGTTPLEFAIGGIANNVANSAAKPAAISGGIALRSLVKGGKLAAHSSNDDKAVKSVGITAVNKLLVAVEDIIKKTVKNVLEKARVEIDKARASKATVQK